MRFTVCPSYDLPSPRSATQQVFDSCMLFQTHHYKTNEEAVYGIGQS
jgi:hypothetical protein